MSSPDQEPPTVSIRSGRCIRLPSRYIDYLPTGNGLPHAPSPAPSPSYERSPSPALTHEEPSHLVEYRTQPNEMGVFRVYPTRPTLVPSGDNNIYALVDAPTLENSDDAEEHDGALHIIRDAQAEITPENLYSAFSSPAAGLLMCWQYSGSNAKSAAELNRLWSYITDPRFDPNAEKTFSHEREQKRIEKYLQAASNPFKVEHGWTTSSVCIPLPHERTRYQGGEFDMNVPRLIVDGVHHRDITDIIVSALQDRVSTTFHMTPYEEYWNAGDHEPIRVFGEAYSSPQLIDAYRKVNSLPHNPGDDLERIVVPLMLWSDATHLASFGDASLWPIYLFLGNQSKYTRGKPSASACHHVAYIPKV